MTSSPEPAPDRRRYLGLDLGGTNIKVAVVQERDAGLPLVVARETRRTEAHRGPDGVVGRLAEVGRDALGRHGPVAAVGVGLPGVYDQDGRAVRVLPAALGPYAGAAGAALRGREAAREALNTASIA
jgi:predicted NBD/HSP70 family sugar kinase